MTVRTWNCIVAAAVIAQVAVCAAVIAFADSPHAAGAALTWMTIIAPLSMGFAILETE